MSGKQGTGRGENGEIGNELECGSVLAKRRAAQLQVKEKKNEPYHGQSLHLLLCDV